MMKIEFVTDMVTNLSCDTIILAINDDNPMLEQIATVFDARFDGQISSLLSAQPWSKKFGATTVLPIMNKFPWRQFILLGAGKVSDLTADKAKSLVAIGMRAAREVRAATAALVLFPPLSVQAAVEGALLGSYRFDRYKTDTSDTHHVGRLLLVNDSVDSIQAAKDIERGIIVADSVNMTRDWVNHPANIMTPRYLAEEAAQLANQYGLGLTVLERENMEELNMGALLAVAQGSQEPPKMLILKHQGKPGSEEWIAFVGKGITFDSGGISIKPSEGMKEMKDDMAGAAAVLGAITAIARLQLSANVMAVIPCTENMPSGTAFRPGDVITSMEGKTIEVVSTDAEGRLILADGLTYARRLGATKLIDIATLTGACVTALGNITSGLITNHDDWGGVILAAAQDAGEKMWQLPSYEEYNEQIKSSIADIKNSGGRPAGAITAGLFLANFTDGLPWAHIDIAGTVTTDKDKGYLVKGATGVGVRTLIQLAENLAVQ